MTKMAFISHASPDAQIALQICEYLENQGIPCWIAPRDVTPGLNYGAEIIKGVQECKVLVLVLSEHANDSNFVKREVERAVSAGKPVLPIRVREVAPSQALELFVSGSHWIDAWQPPIHKYLNHLSEAIRACTSDGSYVSGQDKPWEKPKPWTSKLPLIAAILLIVICVTGGAIWWLQPGVQSGFGQPAEIASTNTPSSAEKIATPKPQLPRKSTEKNGEPKLALPAPPRGEPDGDASATAPQVRSGNAHESFDDIMLLLGDSSGSRRHNLINTYIDQLPSSLSVEQVLAIVGNSGSYRERLLKALADHLPEKLTFDDAVLVLGKTSGSERFNTAQIIAEKTNKNLSTEETLEIIGNSGSYRLRLLQIFADHLPEKLTFDDAMLVLGKTSGSERFNTIQTIVNKIEKNLSASQMVALAGNSGSYRDRAVNLLRKGSSN